MVNRIEWKILFRNFSLRITRTFWEETQEDFRNTIYEMRETVLDLVWIDFVKACH